LPEVNKREQLKGRNNVNLMQDKCLSKSVKESFDERENSNNFVVTFSLRRASEQRRLGM